MSNTTAVMQPYFLPYFPYWQLINVVDTFIFLDDVNYIKRGYINRNYFLINGNKCLLTLNIKNASINKLINSIIIDNNKKKFCTSIKYAYRKAPYYQEVSPLIDKIFNNSEQNLSLFIIYSIKSISDYLHIDTFFKSSSDLKINTDLSGQNRIINICRYLDADRYINPIGGITMYSKSEFKRNNIELFFLKSDDITYKQYQNDFIPFLSVVDVLMFNDLATIRKNLDSYTLI